MSDGFICEELEEIRLNDGKVIDNFGDEVHETTEDIRNLESILTTAGLRTVIEDGCLSWEKHPGTKRPIFKIMYLEPSGNEKKVLLETPSAVRLKARKYLVSFYKKCIAHFVQLEREISESE